MLTKRLFLWQTPNPYRRLEGTPQPYALRERRLLTFNEKEEILTMKKFLTLVLALVTLALIGTGVIAQTRTFVLSTRFESTRTAVSQQVCVQPPKGMVAWWPLNETAFATSFQDIIGGNTGTLFASPVAAAQGPQPVPGEVGGAMHFPKFGNGLSGARVSPQGALANIGAADFTIDAWVQVPAAPANRVHYIVNKFDPAQKRGYALYVVSPGVAGNERLEFKWGDGTNVSTVQTISSLTTGQWHHVAVTLGRNVGASALDIRLYVDGAPQGHQTGNPPGLSSLVNFVFLEIGWQPSSIDEPITIDELDIFNRVLLQSEIQSIFNAGSLGKCFRPPCPAITINPATLIRQTWSANVDYPPLSLTATGGIGPHTFTLSGGTLPPGMVLKPDGTLHGKPVKRGTYDFTAMASDANRCPGVRMYRLSIISCPAINMNPATIPSGTAGTAYNRTFAASGGVAPYSFSESDGSLPPGLTISSAGTLSGTPTQSGTFTSVINVTDANRCTSQRRYRLIIKPCTSCNSADLFSVAALNLQPNEASRYHYFATLKSTARIRAAKLLTEPALSKVLRLSLFPDDVYNVVMDKVEGRRDGSYTWKGTIQGHTGNVILVLQGNQITGWIWVGHATKGERYFSITSLGGGVHVIRQTDQAWFDSISPGCTVATIPGSVTQPPAFVFGNQPESLVTPSGEMIAETGGPREAMPTAVASVSGCTIDVLVVYTQAARDAHGNVPALAQLAIDEANTAYSNSEITGLALNLVGTMEVDYDESDTMTGDTVTDLIRILDPSDGFIDDVHATRQSLQADFVVFIVNDLEALGYWGQADLLATTETAFAVVDWEGAADHLSFAHEVGHLQGADHHPGVPKESNPNYDYGHGSCRRFPHFYRTVMASEKCDQKRVPYFSSPTVKYKKQETGDFTHRNNAQVLRETASAMASLMGPPQTCPPEPARDKCPWPHKEFDSPSLIKGLTVCLSKPDTTIQNHNCLEGDHWLWSPEICVVEEKKGYVRVRKVVEDLCPDLTNKLQGQNNAGRIVCRSVTDPGIQAHNCAEQGNPVWNSPWGKYCLMGESSWHVNVKNLKENLCPDLTSKLEGQNNAGRIVCRSVADPGIQAHNCAEQGKPVWNSSWGKYCLMGESSWHVNVKNLKEDICPGLRDKVGTSGAYIMCKDIPSVQIKKKNCNSLSQDGKYCLMEFNDNYWYRVRKIS